MSFIYIFNPSCSRCHQYEESIDFTKLKHFIENVAHSTFTKISITKNELNKLVSIHPSLKYSFNSFPALIYIDNRYKELRIPSLKFPKIEGNIFNKCHQTIDWIVRVSGNSDTIDCDEDFFIKNNTSTLRSKQISTNDSYNNLMLSGYL